MGVRLLGNRASVTKPTSKASTSLKNTDASAIPFDNIVQDWQYWQRNAWGSHAFDTNRFPDPVGWLKALHALHTHVMISVWGKFYTGTANFDAMQKAGFLYQQNLKEGIEISGLTSLTRFMTRSTPPRANSSGRR